MVSFKRVMHIIVAVGVLGGIAAMDHVASAQEPPPAASPREEQLREQLKGILQELDELQKTREGALPPGERPQGGHRESGAASSPRPCRNMSCPMSVSSASVSRSVRKAFRCPQPFQPKQIHSRPEI